ncbi:MAG: MBL fold metallo-hydrolase [Rikenellaceae bacterium]|jgi:L-ascorbate metabolism protein UlaG (beta-lactamase superfamily)|nr:MBL fold metallo-hydrolase [Rikenellaceae bacterium]
MNSAVTVAAIATMMAGGCAGASGKGDVYETIRLGRDTFPAAQGEIVISFIGHGSLGFQYRGRTVYVDPVRSLPGGEVDYTKLDKADYILITHEHDDHCDATAVRQLSKPDTRVICNGGAAAKLGKGETMANGDVLDVAPWLTAETVPAYNTTPGHEQFHPNNGRDNGYVLTVAGRKIYVSGDTEVIPDRVVEARPEIVFVPVNQPYTMTPETAAGQVRKLAPGFVLYPYHYGGTSTPTDISRLTTLLDGFDADVRIKPMQ